MPESRWRFDLVLAWSLSGGVLAWIASWSSTPLWPGVVVFGVGALVELPFLRESLSGDPDDGFRQVVGMGAVLAVLFLAGSLGFDGSVRAERVGRWASAILLGLAVFLRLRARRDLRGAFRYSLGAGPDRPLVTSGIYARLRHPAYLGAHLFLMAVPLAAGLCSGILASLLLLPTTWRRVLREEALLREVHADAFLRWRASTPALLPLPSWVRKASRGPASGRTRGG